MATLEEEHYLRSVLLLLNGCRYIALKVLQRVEEKERIKSGKNIGIVVHEAKKLKYKFPNHKQREIIFTEKQQVDIEKWDIAIITTVMLSCFKQFLEKPELRALKSIKYQRNEVLAHKARASLSKEEFKDVSEELQQAITILSGTFETSVQDECKAIVDKCLNGSLHGEAKDELKSLPDTDGLLNQILQIVERTEGRIIALTQELPLLVERSVQEAIRKRRDMKEFDGIDAVLTVSGCAEEQKEKKLTEELIITVSEEAIKRVESKAEHSKIREVIDGILQEIEGRGVTVTERRIVLFCLSCNSYEQISELLDLWRENILKEKLQELSKLLRQYLNLKEEPRIKLDFSPTSMLTILENTDGASSSR